MFLTHIIIDVDAARRSYERLPHTVEFYDIVERFLLYLSFYFILG